MKNHENCVNFLGTGTLNGRWIEIVGPFGANGHNNDETILNSMLNTNYHDEKENRK